MNSWVKTDNGALKKSFSFKNYRQSFAFVSQVALLAEKKKSSPKNYIRIQ